MRVPLSWLREFLDIDLAIDEIAETFTLAGLEVEKVDTTSCPGDTVFEIALTPNLGHCMSILGVARELAALKNLSIKKKKISLREDHAHAIDKMVAVQIQDEEQCFRYACRILTNVKVQDSPAWLKNRLEAAGLRSINNVVDVTNFVMLEYGQPLHAFDYAHIAGKKIFVSAKTGYSSFTTLDDKLCPLAPGMLLIADEKKPLALAGVMGGKEAMVTEKSSTILLESAFFSPQAVRKASKLSGIRTDSSQRFEKGIDPEAVTLALERAASLLQEICPDAQVAKGAIDQATRSFTRSAITCRVARTNHLLGTQLSLREIVGIFQRLEIRVSKEEAELLHLIPPSYRNDLQTEIDLIEEVGRVYGFNNIFSKKHPRHVSSTLDPAPLYLMEKSVREQLLKEGLQECITCNLISPTLAELTQENQDKKSLISVLHPASIDQSVLRLSLLPGLLQMVKNNSDRMNKNVSAFEIGKIHFKEGKQYEEQTMAAIICTGLSRPYHWDPKPKEVDFFDLKGKIENLLLSFGIEEISFETAHLHNFHPGRQARILVGAVYVGVVGEVHPLHTAALGISARVLFSELNLHDLMLLRKKREKVEELSPYPGSERDWTLSVKEELAVGEILKWIQEIPSSVLKKVVLLDVYQAAKEKKNITFRLFYQDKEKTISQERVESEHAKITQEVAKKAQDSLV